MSIWNFIQSFGEIFEHPISVVDTDAPDQPLIYINSAFERFSFYTSAEVLGRNCRFLQGPQTDKDSVTKVREHIRSRTAICQDLLNYTKTGEIFFNRLVLLPFSEGNSHYFIGFQHEIPKDLFQGSHQTSHLELMDRIFNPLTILISTAEIHKLHEKKDSTVTELRQNLRPTILRIRNYILELKPTPNLQLDDF
ncbi:MAG TPA: PAS domain-containing protein [Bacteriovoracaceae bacterium]|nr:PAS domain-containing protein [Bacteriovoracaceae bacterium]